MKDFTDYHQIKWVTIKPLPNRKLRIFAHLNISLLITFPSIYIAHELSHHQHQIQAHEVFSLFSLFIFTILLSLNILWYLIASAIGPKIINYNLNKNGITIRKKLHPLNNIDPASVKKAVATNGSNDTLTITLTSLQGKSIVLEFERASAKQKAIHSLIKYFSL